MNDADDLRALAARVRSGAQSFADLQPDLEAGRPWPLSDDFGHTPEAHWGPGEALAHVAEMLSFWTGELERVLDGRPGEDPTPFGRTATDVIRVGLIDRDRTLPPRELVARIHSSAARLAARLEELTPAELAGSTGLHATLGEMTVPQIVDRFVAGHLEEHADQLRGILAGGGRSG